MKIQTDGKIVLADCHDIDIGDDDVFGRLQETQRQGVINMLGQIPQEMYEHHDSVPVKATCKQCGGSGRCSYECDVCEGDGFLSSRYSVNKSCPFCDGWGVMTKRRCESCDGTGENIPGEWVVDGTLINVRYALLVGDASWAAGVIDKDGRSLSVAWFRRSQGGFGLILCKSGRTFTNRWGKPEWVES